MTLVVGEFYRGQGLGNQLYTYASIRGIAAQCGVEYAFVGLDLFKGKDLFDLDFGQEAFDYPKRKCFENRIVDPVCGHDLAAMDFDLLRDVASCREAVKIEGLLAGAGYWPGGLAFLRQILPIKPEVKTLMSMDHRLVLHVRGGDFLFSNSTLGPSYYHAALRQLAMSPSDACVITDDPDHARRLLGNAIQLVADRGGQRHGMTADHHRGGSFVMDFMQLATAHNIVLSNSSFAFWAAVLNLKKARIVAPKHWAARDCVRCHWSPGDFFFHEFEYV